MFKHLPWLGPLCLFILAWLLRQLRLWLKRRKTNREYLRQIDAVEQQQRALLVELENVETIKRDRQRLYQETVDLVRRSAVRGKSYRIEVVDGKAVRTEIDGGNGDVVLTPYEPVDGADMRRQKALDDQSRAAAPPHRKVDRTESLPPRSVASMIADDKKRTADRDAWIRAEAMRIAVAEMDPVIRETLLAEGGQEAVDKALSEAVDAALAKIAEGTKRLSGRLLNAENVKDDADKFRRGLLSLGDPLPDAITRETPPE